MYSRAYKGLIFVLELDTVMVAQYCEHAEYR